MARIASELRKPVKFCLFVASYAPLFLLICLRRLYKGREYLHWAGGNKAAWTTAAREFWLVYALLALTLGSGWLLWRFLHGYSDRVRRGGTRVRVEDIQNKNSEAIGYISSYLVPLLADDYADVYEVTRLLVLLLITWQLYVRSSLLGVNPTLNLFGYALYEIQFDDRPSAATPLRLRTGLMLIRAQDVEEDDWLQVKRIAHKLYFATPAPNA